MAEELLTNPPTQAPDRIRTFFALVPEEDVRLQFVSLARDVARRSRGRAVSGDHIHLTVAFLGDVPLARVPELRAIGERLPRRGARLAFDTLGAWRASGVAWIAPSEVAETLLILHASLHEALAVANFGVETRPFRPHVTLARRCVQPHPRTRCAPIHWPVERLCLVGSQLRPEGPLHSTLAEWVLGA
ncbi:MAG: RNA 2',3'-cyclic phosphodiesterase [Burkholderiales bacterium]|nr:RNA 2',3'-cyclic phosphodiesterase [Burkholderiales bacterium]